MIAYWYKTYIRCFGEGAKKRKKGKVVTTGIRPVLACSLPKLFFVFFSVVCRYCTRRQSYGNFCLRLVMQVFVDVFVCDWEKKVLVMSFGRPPEVLKHYMFWWIQKSFTKIFFSSFFLQCRWGCLYYKFRSLFSLSLYNGNRKPTNTVALVHHYYNWDSSKWVFCSPPLRRPPCLSLSVCWLRAAAVQQWWRWLMGGGGGRLAAAWRAERRQHSSGNSFTSAWQRRWKHSSGGGGGGSAVVVVAAQWLWH